MTKLSDLGERRIIQDYLRLRYEHRSGPPHFGDDCALVASVAGSGTLVATTDPCPVPAATALGYEDLYYWGWLLATINLSDLAAAGAKPLGLLTSFILPNDMDTNQFERLLDGLDDCCRQSGAKVIGGNLKEGNSLQLSATAIGLCDAKHVLSRSGGSVGDKIVVIGDLGRFWAGFLAIRERIEVPAVVVSRLLEQVLKPQPHVRIGHAIAERGLMTACMDNSDGLFPTLQQLALANNARCHVAFDDTVLSDEVITVATALGVDPIRFALGWGDWQLVGCVKAEALGALTALGSELGVPITVIGHVETGTGVWLEHKGLAGPMAAIDSQRFTETSWFTTGIEAYVQMLLRGPLFAS